jgi:hypothetical protein
MRYPPERKEAVLRKMIPPHNRSIKKLCQEEGISEATLFNWRKEAREKGLLLPHGNSGPEGWSARDKFAAVLESASFNETELSEHCRKRGIYPEQLTAEGANGKKDFLHMRFDESDNPNAPDFQAPFRLRAFLLSLLLPRL